MDKQYRITKYQYFSKGEAHNTCYKVQEYIPRPKLLRKILPFKDSIIPEWMYVTELNCSWGDCSNDPVEFKTEKEAEKFINYLLSGGITEGSVETVVKYIP